MKIGKIFANIKHMKFSKFLFELGVSLQCINSSDLFDKLDGERGLGVKFRTFRALYSGQIPPSAKVFDCIFSKVPNQLRKEAVLSFLVDSVGNKDLSAFIAKNLSVDFDAPIVSTWSKKHHKILTIDQMNCIASTGYGIRVFQRIMCNGFLSISEVLSLERRRVLDSFVAIGLVKNVKNGWEPISTHFRFPHPEVSSSHAVRVATEFIGKHLPAYLLTEAHPKVQELGFSFHTCLEENAKKILNEMRNFKSWVQGFSLTEHHPSEVSFVWLDFARILRGNEGSE